MEEQFQGLALRQWESQNIKKIQNSLTDKKMFFDHHDCHEYDLNIHQHHHHHHHKHDQDPQ